MNMQIMIKFHIMKIEFQFRKWIYPKLRIGVLTRSIPFSLKNKISILSEQIRENENLLIQQNPYFHLKWVKDFNTSYKYGGYRRIAHKYYWSHRKLYYFNFNDQIYGGIPKIIKKMQLSMIREIEYYPVAIEPNEVSKYTFKVKKRYVENFDINRGFSLNIGGIDYFQHFIQDSISIVSATKSFLCENPDIVLLLPKKNYFQSRDFFLNLLGIKNEVAVTDTRPLSIKELFFWNFKPFNAKFDLPKSWIKSMYLNVQESNLILNPKNLVLITRNEKTRNFGNKNEVIRFFKELATASNLNFILLESDTTTLSEYKSSLENAKIVVALHGGANYNLIFAHRQCIFFEFIPTRNTNSLLNFIVSLGICYIPVPVDADFNDHFVYIGAEILEEISKIAKIFNRQNS